MKTVRKALACLTLVCAAIGAGTPYAYATSYHSLAGVDGLDVAYDFRLTDPKTAALFLRLIHETWLDRDVQELKDPASFVVVVNGGAVKLIASDQPGYSAEDKFYLVEIADRVAQMAADGIRFEGCLKAAEIFGVDHHQFLTEINKINNAWISIAGYQAQDYSALPIN